MIAELTIAALAAAAVTEAVKTLSKESTTASLKVLGWLRDKLTGRSKEALEDLEQNPSSEDNQADLRKQLTKLLEAQPELRTELQALLPVSPQGGDSMNQTVQGAGAKAAQTKGNYNTTTIK